MPAPGGSVASDLIVFGGRLDCSKPWRLSRGEAPAEETMKRIILVLAVTVLAAGCATIGGGASAENEIDTAYVAAVEGAAKRFGTQVIWIHYPRKRAESTQ
jgi:hypothetical protein